MTEFQPEWPGLNKETYQQAAELKEALVSDEVAEADLPVDQKAAVLQDDFLRDYANDDNGNFNAAMRLADNESYHRFNINKQLIAANENYRTHLANIQEQEDALMGIISKINTPGFKVTPEVTTELHETQQQLAELQDELSEWDEMLESNAEANELGKEVRELAVGSVLLHTYESDATAKRIHQIHQQNGRQNVSPSASGYAGGWNTQSEKYGYDNKIFGTTDSTYTPSLITEASSRGAVHEYVVFLSQVQPVYEEVDIERSEKKRFGGYQKVSATEDRLVDVRPESYHAVAGRGPDEPAVRVEYHFKSSAWRADQSRGGRELTVGFTLPQTQAQELQTRLMTEPRAIRNMVEEILLDYGYPEDVWENGEDWGRTDGNNSTKPPYDEVPSDHVIRLFSVEPKPDPESKMLKPIMQETEIAAVPAA